MPTKMWIRVVLAIPFAVAAIISFTTLVFVGIILWFLSLGHFTLLFDIALFIQNIFERWREND